MRIFIFKSEMTNGLCAFAGDSGGFKLPEQLGPWTVTGAIPADRTPPHGLSRDTIDEAIATEGFQLWRVKTKPKIES